MSFVTTVILIFSGVEDEEERIKEVNSFPWGSYQLDLRSIDNPRVCYGGNKKINGYIYIGSYNYFEVERFLNHVSEVKWEKSEYVQILISNENEWNYSLYGNAGKELLHKAVRE